LDIAAAVKAIGLGKPPLIVKCDAFYKKPDGSWEPDPRSGHGAEEYLFLDKYLDAYCNAKADPFGLQHPPFKAG
jgi:hypothetical protein